MGAASGESNSFAERGQRRARAGAGFALPAALLMILLIAALIAGVFGAITEETRIGVAASDRQHALWSAESAIELTIAAFPDDSMRLGETRSRPVDGLGVPVMVYVTRLDSSRYWLVADAGSASPNSGIARKVGVVVRATNRADRSMAIDRISERAWSELF
jgi:type II secretory pathway pseudopilin PulG